MMLAFICFAVGIGSGLILIAVARLFELTDALDKPLRITIPEFVAGSATIALLTFLVVVLIGPNLARDSAVKGYKQFYNGSVVETRIVTNTCTRDGSCRHTYKCDPYWVEVVDSYAYTDSDGIYHPEQSHMEQRWHHCPYVTKELDYVLDDNIGRTITIGDNYFEASPKEWRSGKGIPSDVPREPPTRWLTAQSNLAAGISDPVTDVREYSNFILPSDNDLYKEYDGNIETYQKLGLLPKHTENLGKDMMFDYNMRANKVMVAGDLQLNNLDEWQNRLMRFNAALGSDLQGDMHIVLVPAKSVADTKGYVNSLKAYWTSLGKWSIAKNAIILVIGVSEDGSTVEWSRGETGMPFGNGELIESLDLQIADQPFDPSVLLGEVTTSVVKEDGELEVEYDHGSGGIIGEIVFTKHPFQRACMECNDEDDSGTSYVGLKDEIPLTTESKIWMSFTNTLLVLLVWGFMLFTDVFSFFVLGKTSSNEWPPRRSSSS